MPKDNKVKKEKKHYFKNFKAELKKVNWPTPKQLVNNTVAVITIVLITTIIVFALDLVFEKLNTNGVNKLKEIVGNSVENNNEIDTENNVDETSQTEATENSEEQTPTEEVTEPVSEE